MLANQLNKIITIERGADATTAVKSPKLVYEEYMSTWANVYVRSAVTRFDENEELFFTTEFTIRYNSKTKDINNKYRILYNGDYYKIVEIIESQPKTSIKMIAVHYGN